MSERYDSTSARHYAAYRPPLHRLILERLIHPNETFGIGLDVGCGTGYSAVALANHCGKVVGLDPSRSMLDSAQHHPGVSYLQGSGDSLGELPAGEFEVITFAGSLFYAKSDALRDGLARVCRPGGVVLVYDFEILLDDLMTRLGAGRETVVSDYDHRVNLCDWPEFKTVCHGSERLRWSTTFQEMAHLLLSDSHRFDALAKRFPGDDPFEALVQRLRELGGEPSIAVDIHFTRHQIADCPAHFGG